MYFHGGKFGLAPLLSIISGFLLFTGPWGQLQGKTLDRPVKRQCALISVGVYHRRERVIKPLPSPLRLVFYILVRILFTVHRLYMICIYETQEKNVYQRRRGSPVFRV